MSGSYSLCLCNTSDLPGIRQFATGFRDGAVEGSCGFHPFRDDDLCVGGGFFVGGPIGRAAGEFGNFDDKAFVGFPPVDDEFLAHDWLIQLALAHRAGVRADFRGGNSRMKAQETSAVWPLS